MVEGRNNRQKISCLCKTDNGRRYTAELMQTAIELMLRSRSCYKALLNILALPSNQQWNRRMHSLIADTSNALHQTLSGLVALIKYKLDVWFKYVLPGKDQSDRIEAEFGIYRQSSGRNYCISTYQVYNGLKLQRLFFHLINSPRFSDYWRNPDLRSSRK